MLKTIKRTPTGTQPSAYYFFHIPKTAGTTLNTALLDIFAPDQICPPFLWHQLLNYERQSLKKFQLFRGHFYAALEPFLGFAVKSFVFLRNPIERALSHYGHVMRAPKHYLHEKAVKLQTFEAFLREEETRETISNFQSKCLVASFDPAALAAGLSDTELNDLKLERQIETAPPLMTSEHLLNGAIVALNRFECICITEYFDDSTRLLRHQFGWNMKTSINPLNQNPQRLQTTSLTCKEAELLHELNTIDLRVYEEARRMFREQVCALPESLAVRC